MHRPATQNVKFDWQSTWWRAAGWPLSMLQNVTSMLCGLKHWFSCSWNPSWRLPILTTKPLVSPGLRAILTHWKICLWTLPLTSLLTSSKGCSSYDAVAIMLLTSRLLRKVFSQPSWGCQLTGTEIDKQTNVDPAWGKALGNVALLRFEWKVW